MRASPASGPASATQSLVAACRVAPVVGRDASFLRGRPSRSPPAPRPAPVGRERIPGRRWSTSWTDQRGVSRKTADRPTSGRPRPGGSGRLGPGRASAGTFRRTTMLSGMPETRLGSMPAGRSALGSKSLSTSTTARPRQARAPRLTFWPVVRHQSLAARSGRCRRAGGRLDEVIVAVAALAHRPASGLRCSRPRQAHRRGAHPAGGEGPGLGRRSRWGRSRPTFAPGRRRGGARGSRPSLTRCRGDLLVRPLSSRRERSVEPLGRDRLDQVRTGCGLSVAAVLSEESSTEVVEEWSRSRGRSARTAGRRTPRPRGRTPFLPAGHRAGAVEAPGRG